jgi:hypothetical protein
MVDEFAGIAAAAEQHLTSIHEGVLARVAAPKSQPGVDIGKRSLEAKSQVGREVHELAIGGLKKTPYLLQSLAPDHYRSCYDEIVEEETLENCAGRVVGTYREVPRRWRR